jgi:AraC-like DNA-binding protein
MGSLADRDVPAPALRRAAPSLAPAPALPEAELLSGAHAPTRFAPHWHDAWGLAAITAGACRFTCAGVRCVARAGDLVLLPALAVHTAGVDARGLEMSMLYLPPALVAELTGVLAGRDPEIDRYVLTAPALARRLAAAARAGERGALRSVAGKALRRFHRACGGGARPRRRPEDADPRVAALCAALRGGAPPPVRDLAAALGLSRSYLQRLFRRVVGLTPGEYRRLWRLAGAKARLAAGDAPAEVAAAAGFADQAHLSRWVHRVYGVTPGHIGRRARPRGAPRGDRGGRAHPGDGPTAPGLPGARGRGTRGA